MQYWEKKPCNVCGKETSAAGGVCPRCKKKQAEEDAKKPFAENLPYWKTGTSDPMTHMDNAMEEITRAGGTVTAHMLGMVEGRAAILLGFQIDGDAYRVEWPVLQSKTGDSRAAMRQAATMMFYDVKARCLSYRVLGARRSFMSWLCLPDGRTAGQVAVAEPSLLGQLLAPGRLLVGGQADE